MLLQEEQYVFRWLSQYGTLTKKQIVALLHHKPEATAERIISNLLRSRLIFRTGGGVYLSSDPLSKPDERLLTAIWILTKFIQSIDPMAHYRADYPSQIFFLKDTVGYEVVVLNQDEGHLLRLLQPQDDLKYIIVVPDIGMVPNLPLPDAPCLFATVDLTDAGGADITFYSEEEAFHGKL